MSALGHSGGFVTSRKREAQNRLTIMLATNAQDAGRPRFPSVGTKPAAVVPIGLNRIDERNCK